jgi:hypothetical protein
MSALGKSTTWATMGNRPMNLNDLARVIPNLTGQTHVEKIKAFAWHLHAHCEMDRFGLPDIQACYDSLHYAKPRNLSGCLAQLQGKKPPDLLKDKRGYRLEGRIRETFDARYGTRPLTIIVETLLADLSDKVPCEAERLFLAEAISCFRIKAFRAAIVMTWNVAYDHFEEWIIRNHLAAFNARISVNFSRKAGVVIKSKEDFSDHLKESEVIEISKSAGFLHDNIKKIMIEKLTRRNLAAHPSLVEITQFQAEDMISDLINNVILKLV